MHRAWLNLQVGEWKKAEDIPQDHLSSNSRKMYLINSNKKQLCGCPQLGAEKVIVERGTRGLLGVMQMLSILTEVTAT